MGIELTGGVEITRWLDWSGNLTLSRNKIKNFTESIEVYDADWNFLREDHNDLGQPTSPFRQTSSPTACSISTGNNSAQVSTPSLSAASISTTPLAKTFHRSLFRQQPACRLRFQTEVYEGDRPRCHDQQFVQRAI